MGKGRVAFVLRHVELAEANAYIKDYHRHHKKAQGHRFSLGAFLDGKLVGVAVVGRPVGGQHQRDWVEVTRLCTDGTPHTCSFLYAAAARAAKALGYERIQTYILLEEEGASLRGAGWKFERLSHPSGWHHGPKEGSTARAARKVAEHLMDRKNLWFLDLRKPAERHEEEEQTHAA